MREIILSLFITVRVYDEDWFNRYFGRYVWQDVEGHPKVMHGSVVSHFEESMDTGMALIRVFPEILLMLSQRQPKTKLELLL